jgi:hypothetical protein
MEYERPPETVVLCARRGVRTPDLINVREEVGEKRNLPLNYFAVFQKFEKYDIIHMKSENNTHPGD